MPFFKKPLAGPAWLVLNIIRVINIICLAAVTAASFAMLVKTFNVSKFFFFDGVSHVITGFLSLALLLTEVSLFARYIAHNWPLLCPRSSFLTLGSLMIFLGISLLGNLNKTATSRKSMGPHFYGLTIAAGILVSIFGVINILASYVFRSKSLGITARQYRMYGNEAVNNPYYWPPVSKSVMAKSVGGSGRRSFILSRSSSGTLPTYERDAKPTYQRPDVRSISSPLPVSPVEGKVQRPEDIHPHFRQQI